MKKIDFPEAVEEGVALVGLIALYCDQLEKAGHGKLIPIGRQVVATHADLMEKWQTYATDVRRQEGLYGLFQTCRDVINPVQSALQNLIHPKGTAIMAKGVRPEAITTTHIEGLALAPEKLLSAIIQVKENWAYIDAHPQVVVQKV